TSRGLFACRDSRGHDLVLHACGLGTACAFRLSVWQRRVAGQSNLPLAPIFRGNWPHGTRTRRPLGPAEPEAASSAASPGRTARARLRYWIAAFVASSRALRSLRCQMDFHIWYGDLRRGYGCKATGDTAEIGRRSGCELKIVRAAGEDLGG